MFYPFTTDKMGADAGNMIKDPKVSQLLTLDMQVQLDAQVPLAGVRAGKETARTDIYKEVFATLDPKVTLYVCGHCSPGGTEFQAPDTKHTITAMQLAGYLSALPKNWPGRIRPQLAVYTSRVRRI